jgi:hypothetical protein
VKRCSRCHLERPLTDFGRRAASGDGLQSYCRPCVSAWAREHRPRRLVDAPSVEPGQKWCRSCETTKPLTEFAGNRSAKDGLQAHCRTCQADRYRQKQEAQGKLVRPRDVPEGSKFCRTCKTIKPLTEWSRNRHASDGLQTRCKPCTSADARTKYFMKSYRMTEREVEALRASQGGVCAICRSAPAVHVDHDHRTGEVRGMCCFSCNAALGHFKDDPAVLRRAADYLEGGATPMTGSRRDEAAWAAVLAKAPTPGPSLLEEAFRVRLAELGVGPAS